MRSPEIFTENTRARCDQNNQFFYEKELSLFFRIQQHIEQFQECWNGAASGYLLQGFDTIALSSTFSAL